MGQTQQIQTYDLSLPDNQDYRKSLQRLRWFRATFAEQIAAIETRTSIKFTLDCEKLTACFVQWFSTFDATKPIDHSHRPAFVGYAAGKSSQGTDPDEAKMLVEQTGLDALAISAGNTHLQTEQLATIDEDLVRQIANLVPCPLVLHGGSGIPAETRRHLAREKLVQKFNVGTEVRQVFGASLRAHLDSHPDDFDRLSIMSSTIDPICEAAKTVIANLRQR